MCSALGSFNRHSGRAVKAVGALCCDPAGAQVDSAQNEVPVRGCSVGHCRCVFQKCLYLEKNRANKPRKKTTFSVVLESVSEPGTLCRLPAGA